MVAARVGLCCVVVRVRVSVNGLGLQLWLK